MGNAAQVTVERVWPRKISINGLQLDSLYSSMARMAHRGRSVINLLHALYILNVWLGSNLRANCRLMSSRIRESLGVSPTKYFVFLYKYFSEMTEQQRHIYCSTFRAVTLKSQGQLPVCAKLESVTRCLRLSSKRSYETQVLRSSTARWS